MRLKGKRLVLGLFFLLFFVNFEMVGQVINNSSQFEEGNVVRKSSFNIDEIKVRWKKAALDNCTGVPCVANPPAPSFTCGTSTIMDIDLNSYNTVSIGAQCWTTTNLKVTKYNDGTLIGDSTNSTWGTAMIGARTGFKEGGLLLSGYVETFGYLYNWYAVTDSRKLCPDGWHVPTNSDWNKLVKSIHSGADTSTAVTQSTTAGLVLKSNVTNTTGGSGLGWDPAFGASPGTNTTGFSALPGGYRNGSSFNDVRARAFFWSATQDNNVNLALNRNLSKNNSTMSRNDDSKKVGSSVRCLKD